MLLTQRNRNSSIFAEEVKQTWLMQKKNKIPIFKIGDQSCKYSPKW